MAYTEQEQIRIIESINLWEELKPLLLAQCRAAKLDIDAIAFRVYSETCRMMTRSKVTYKEQFYRSLQGCAGEALLPIMLGTGIEYNDDVDHNGYYYDGYLSGCSGKIKIEIKAFAESRFSDLTTPVNSMPNSSKLKKSSNKVEEYNKLCAALKIKKSEETWGLMFIIKSRKDSTLALHGVVIKRDYLEHAEINNIGTNAGYVGISNEHVITDPVQIQKLISDYTGNKDLNIKKETLNRVYDLGTGEFVVQDIDVYNEKNMDNKLLEDLTAKVLNSKEVQIVAKATKLEPEQIKKLTRRTLEVMGHDPSTCIVKDNYMLAYEHAVINFLISKYVITQHPKYDKNAAANTLVGYVPYKLFDPEFFTGDKEQSWQALHINPLLYRRLPVSIFDNDKYAYTKYKDITEELNKIIQTDICKYKTILVYTIKDNEVVPYCAVLDLPSKLHNLKALSSGAPRATIGINKKYLTYL
jgi:hypothetical protein